MTADTKKYGTRRWGLAGALVALYLATGAHGQMIRLSERAVVVAGQDVRLGNIATVQGGHGVDAAALANTIVLPAVASGRTVRAENVLMAVIAQLGASGVADQLQLSGAASCEIVVSATGAAPSPAASTPSIAVVTPAMTVPLAGQTAAAAAESGNAPVVTASVVSEGASAPAANTGTLSQLITARLGQELGVGPSDFQVLFDTVSPLLDAPATEGSQWQFRPLTRTFVGMVEWQAELVRGSRIVQHLTVETRVTKRERVLVAAMQIPRGTPITKDCYSVQDVWLDRNMPTLFTNETEIAGLGAQREISVGENLDQRDFKPVLMAQRGDGVTVIFLSGALKVKMNGRAMKDGKMHDQIPIRNEVTQEQYQAVLIGKNLAVVGGTLTDAQEKLLRETR